MTKKDNCEHEYSKVHSGIRICKKCNHLDKFYGYIGHLRSHNKMSDSRYTDEMIRAKWMKMDESSDFK